MSFIIKCCFYILQPLLCPQSCPTLCNPMGCSPPGSSVCGIFQARILEQTSISFSKWSSQPRDRTHVSYVSCIGRWILYHWVTWKIIYQCMQSHFSCVWLCMTLWTVACQALLSKRFSRQEYRSGLPFLLQWTFLTQRANSCLLHLLHWQVGSSPLGPLNLNGLNISVKRPW